MQWLVFAVLLVVVRASPPVLRQAADNSARTGGSIQSQSNPNKTPPAQSQPPVNANAAPNHDAHRNEQGTDDAGHSISVSKLPPVTVVASKRDWADWGYWVFSGLLVVVGGLQIWLLRRTFGAIQRQADLMERQTKATEDAAMAAKNSTDALIASERAWIDGEIIKSVIIGLTRFSLNITNHGRTPAQIFGYEIRHGLLAKGIGFSVENLSIQIIANDYFFLASGDTKTPLKEFDMDKLFTGAEGTETGALCITIKYGDVVSGEWVQQKEHETSFVYYYDVLSSSLTRQSTYNKYT